MEPVIAGGPAKPGWTPTLERGRCAAAASRDAADAQQASGAAAHVLSRLGELAVAVPPRNLAILVASVQKYLLTDLEPAMRLAQELREHALAAEFEPAAATPSPDRRDQSLELLAG